MCEQWRNTQAYETVSNLVNALTMDVSKPDDEALLAAHTHELQRLATLHGEALTAA